MSGKQEERWVVVCSRFVSAGFDDKDKAYEHLRVTRHLGVCKETHLVQFTDLPYGTRAREVKP